LHIYFQNRFHKYPATANLSTALFSELRYWSTGSVRNRNLKSKFFRVQRKHILVKETLLECFLLLGRATQLSALIISDEVKAV